jgi:predicted RNase H-like nuclease (RuvC/YqgF family)
MTKDSDIFKYNNLTDFEKLLFAKGHIKELQKELKALKAENGILQSEIDELKFLLKQEKPENNKLYSYKKQIKDIRKKCKELKSAYNKLQHEMIISKQN